MVPFGFAHGWQWYGSSGDISIPRVSLSRLSDIWTGGYTSLRDVLRHEFAHAIADTHRGLFRSGDFSEAFGAAHHWNFEWEHDPEHHVSKYAATAPAGILRRRSCFTSATVECFRPGTQRCRLSASGNSSAVCPMPFQRACAVGDSVSQPDATLNNPRTNAHHCPRASDLAACWAVRPILRGNERRSGFHAVKWQSPNGAQHPAAPLNNSRATHAICRALSGLSAFVGRVPRAALVSRLPWAGLLLGLWPAAQPAGSSSTSFLDLLQITPGEGGTRRKNPCH